MILIIYGSRTWTEHNLIYDVIERVQPRIVVHGDHWAGADQYAYQYCDKHGILQARIPAPWENKDLGKGAGPFRNGIVLLTGFLYADWYQEPLFTCGFRKDGKSNGTDDMNEKCEKAKVMQKISWNFCGNGADWDIVLASGEFDRIVKRHKIEGFAPVR
jgi:hypothetical protein